jgi:hypothetical protein
MPKLKNMPIIATSLQTHGGKLAEAELTGFIYQNLKLGLV